MSMSLRAAITAIQAHALIAGALEAPIDPPESNAGFPFSVCYPNTGKISVETKGVRRDTSTLVLDFHLTRQNLPMNVEAAETFMEAFPDRLIDDPSLGGVIDTINFDTGVTYQFGEMSYAGVKTIGWRFSIPIKIRRSTA